MKYMFKKSGHLLCTLSISHTIYSNSIVQFGRASASSFLSKALSSKYDKPASFKVFRFL